MSGLIRMRALANFHLDADTIVHCGETFSTSPFAAGEILNCGRAELLDLDDREAIAAAMHQQTRAALASCGPIQPTPGSPWISSRLH